MSESNSPQNEVFALSPNLLNMLIGAILLLVIGVIIGLLINADQNMEEETIRRIVIEVIEEVGGVTKKDYLADDDPFIGPEDAPITIVEFSDFLCGFCGRHFQQTLTPLLAHYEGKIRYVYRDFPGVGGQNAVQSAMAAHCANDQGKFWEYHALLFENQSLLGTGDDDKLRSVLIDHAEALELELASFTACLDNQTYLSDVNRDRTDGLRNGVGGTPAFFINGIFISGAQPYDYFADIIDGELAAMGLEG